MVEFRPGSLLSAVNVYGTKAHQATIIEGAAAHAAGLLKNYLNYLDVIVTLSPLMGLLGTVIGMIGSFDVLSTADGQPLLLPVVLRKHWCVRQRVYSLPL